jgi:transcriptional regulator with XRE-family HTH domain
MKWSCQEAKFYADLGARLRRRREVCELTQQQLGDSAGLTRASIANIEAGLTRIQVHTLVAFADALMVSVSRLVP